MSSNTYSTCLTPDPWLRIFVLTTGRVLGAAGLVILLTLDLEVAVRALGCLAWFALGQSELARVERGFASCSAIRLSSEGEIAVLNDDQEWRSGILETGSLVLRNFAWLRLRTADGDLIVELLRGDIRQSQEWRRLQVIWRHIGA